MTTPEPGAPIAPPAPRSRWLAAFSDGPGMLREIVIVVAGVLLAFGADRAGEAMATAQRTKTAEAGLRVEVRRSLLHAAEVVSYADCRRDRVAEMTAAVRARQPLPAPLSLPIRPWTNAVWRSALTSGAAEDLPRERLTAYARLYGGFEALFERQFTMRDHRIAAGAADFPGIGASDRAEAATRLALLQADLNISATIATEMLEIARTDLDMAPPSQGAARFARAAATTCGPTSSPEPVAASERQASNAAPQALP